MVGRGPVHEVLLVGSCNAERLVLGGASLAGLVRVVRVVLLLVEALDGEPPGLVVGGNDQERLGIALGV
jgi:hypothetical protein